MTALGKLLVIFVFLLAAVETGFIVITYATRTNWRADAERNAKIADINYKGAQAVKDQNTTTTDDARAQVAALAAEVERLKDELKNEKAISAQQGRSYEEKLAADRKNEATIETLQQTIKSQQDQLALRDKQTKDQNARIDTLIKTAADAVAKMEDAILSSKSFQQQAERLTTRLQEAADRYDELKRGGNTLLAARPAPENFRGTVRAYKDGFVEITPGLNAGLREGTVLLIQRIDGANGKYVGTLTIGPDINPDKAVGRWDPPKNVPKPTADDLPKVGDEVVPKKQ